MWFWFLLVCLCIYSVWRSGQVCDLTVRPPHPPPHTPRRAGPSTQHTWARLCFLYSSARLFSRSRTKARRRVVGKVTAEGWVQAGPSSVSHGHCRQLDAPGRPLEHGGWRRRGEVSLLRWVQDRGG